jgi:hypothetical protein
MFPVIILKSMLQENSVGTYSYMVWSAETQS